MSKRKPNKTLSEKICDVFTPNDLPDDPDDDGDEVTKAKLFDYELDNVIDTRLSNIRKSNVKLLNDIDTKYRGKISSRHDIENDTASNESDNEYEPSEDSDADSDNDSSIETPTNEQSIKQDIDEDDSENDDADADDDDGDDEIEDEQEESDGSLADVTVGLYSDNDNELDNTTSETQSTITLKPKDIGEDIRKGVAVQNQLQIWENLLEIRIQSQKLLQKSNSYPNYEQLPNIMNHKDTKFLETNQKTNENLQNLLTKMISLQTILTKKFPETKNINVTDNVIRKRKHPSSKQDEDLEPTEKLYKFESILNDNFINYKPYRNSIVQKWYDRTKILTPGQTNLTNPLNSNIIRRIDTILLNKDDLIRKSQLVKGNYKLFGNPDTVAESTDDNANDDRDTDKQYYSNEIYDDTDFYHTQLRELIEYKTNISNSGSDDMARQFIELQKLRNKMKKKVDTRASKGRKIRYAVHKKLVNFMAPNDTVSELTDEAKTELFSSLFGGKM